jgi:hypothetical protein
MAFNNIDCGGEGNRRARRAVAVIQRKAGAEGRLAAAQAKRQRKMARSFERDLDRTIVFYAMPVGGTHIDDAEGAYIWGGNAAVEGRYQVVVIGKLRADLEHYIMAIGVFLKKPVRLVSSESLAPPSPMTEKQSVKFARGYLSIIVEPEQRDLSSESPHHDGIVSSSRKRRSNAEA